MKIKNYLVPVLILLFSYSINAQVVKAFTPRLPGGSIKIKGNIVFVGNNIVNRTTTQPTYNASNVVTNQAVLTAEANIPYNGPLANNNFNFDYIDIDGDPTTFSSSTADLNITSSCKRVVYAGLYWTATYPFERNKNNSSAAADIIIPRQNDWNQVQFKLPGGAYQLMVADNAADAPGQEDDIIVDNNQSFTNGIYGVPYVCYKNVTGLVQGLANANGTYGVANQRGQLGKFTNTGSSAGWSLVIIYEDPALPSKYISTFDGYANVNGSGDVDFNINGFVTLPAPFPVRARIGVSALEGDLEYTGDNLRFKANSFGGGFNDITNTTNPVGNFFNASITNNNIPVTNRNINSSNTLGFDLDIVDVPPGIVPNNETGATIRLTTGGDAYGPYLTTFDVEIIEPKIVLTKTVQDVSGVDAAGQIVTLCQPLNYTIGFQNIGNDPATNFTIKDILPPNVSFNPASVILPAPPVGCPAITFVYTAATRTIVFTIPPCFVIKNGPRYEIKLGVKVLCTCLELDDACSNLIKNQAFATYQGVDNTAVITNDPSLSSFSACNASPPSPTNTLAGLDACNFNTTVTLCGTTVRLDAAPGYQTYIWSGPAGATITPVAGTNNASVIVNQVGVYTVNNLITLAPCKSILQTINVVDISGTPPLTNPVLALVPSPKIIVKLCPNSNINPQLPEITLCGASDFLTIPAGVTGALSISWEQLSGVCLPLPNPNCANENPSCTWTVVGTGASFTANAPGQFRVVYTFAGGCSRTFYFNVFQNTLNPTIVPRDAVCNTSGNITITNVPAGYEYQVNCTGAWSPITTTTTIPLPVGVYSICIRQIGVPGGCVFTYPNIGIAQRTFTSGESIIQPLCATDKGCIDIFAYGVYPQYTYTVNQLTPTVGVIGTFGPTTSASTPTTPTRPFCNLSPGNYTYTITTQDGCTITKPFTIIQPPALTITAGITKPLSCAPGGEITVYPVGGKLPLNYSVTFNATPIVVTQSSPIITAALPGNYCITVTDANLCKATVCIVVPLIPPPAFTVTPTPVLCYGASTGAINFNVTSANGFTILYSILGGASGTFFSTPSFTNLPAGTYATVIQYTLGTAVCTSTPVNITIGQPFAALTASAGVSELAGCGPAGEGKVRITNPQGGVGPYTYSFDNQVTYTPVNEAYLPCGTYTVYIKDANGCIFAMPVILDCAPTPPTIVVSPPVFACNGNATSTVTITNQSSPPTYSYTYAIGTPPVLNTPPNNPIFTNVPCGSNVVTVNYVVNAIPTPSNLLFEDFGIGANTTTPGIAAAYCFNPQAYPAGQPCGNFVAGFPASACGTWFVNDNQYVVTKALNPNNCAWFDFRDHTSASPGPINPNGRFLAVNIGGAAGPNGILYSKTINNILPNQPIIVEAYLANLLRANLVGGSDPSFAFELATTAGVVIASQSSTDILRSNTWQLRTVTLNPGANTTLIFRVRSGSVIYGGNDALIDDIRVYQLPKVCITTRSFPINIACNQAFTAQVTGTNNVTCNGLSNGSITIAAQNFAATGFYYSTNGVAGPFTNSLTSPVTINTLGAGTYNVVIRYDLAGTVPACNFPITTTITQPTAVTGTVVITPATCLTGAVVTVTASGGTPAYMYQLQGTPTFPYQSSNVFTNVPAGNYVVLVKDANSCLNPVAIPVNIVAPVAPTAVIAASSNFCYSSPLGASIVVTPSGGLPPYQYNINAGTFQNNNIFGSLNPGTYTIIVRDAAGCTFTLPAQIIAPQLTASAVLTKDLDCSASPAALITTTIVGGYAGYTYQVNTNGTLSATVNPIVGSTFTFIPPGAGTYFFVITDSKGCKTNTNSIIINPIVLPTATTTVTNVTCNGLLNGSFVINATLGVGPYTYSFNGSATFTNTTSYTGLAAGTYTYIVKDAKGCTFNGSVTITQPASIAGIATLTTPYTCTGAGVITVSGVSGGTPGYTYSIGGSGGTFQAGLTFPITAAGTYIVTIKDSKGCTFDTLPIVVTPLTPPTNIAFAATALSCPANTSNVTLTVTGGSPALSYQQILPTVGIAQASNIFNGLTPGTYTFEVTDSRNCKYSESYTITPLPTLTLIGNVVSNVACFGTATGSLSFTVGGFAPNYNYTVTGGPTVVPAGTGITATTVNIGSLLAGTYTILVTNPVTNCTKTLTLTVAQPAAALAITLTTSPVTCLANGKVTVNATGGWGGNVYTMSPLPVGVIQSTNVFTNIPAGGPYTITTTDSNGCAVTATFSLVAPVLPSATISAASDFCFDSVNGASITITPSGANPPFTYTINGASNATNVFTGLTPVGSPYTIVVTDAFGCAFTLPAQVIAPQLTLSTVLTKDLDCSASPDAVITGTIGGGYSGYTYAVRILPSATYTNLGPVPAVPGNVFTYSTSTAGSFQFEVTDSKGCKVQSTIITINPLIPVTATQTSTNNVCFGDSAGTVVITPSGGVGAYQVNFNSLGFSPSLTYTSLAAGTYTYIVRDSKLCTFNGTVTITQPSQITYTTTVNPITCTGAGTSLGSICVNAPTGGTPPYTYTLFDQNTAVSVVFGPTPSVTHCFPNLNFGLFTIEVSDSKNCTIVQPNIIMSSPPNDLTLGIVSLGATCAAGACAAITVNPIVAGGPYVFGLVDQGAPLYSSNFLPIVVGPPYGPGPFPLVYNLCNLPTGTPVTICVKDLSSGCLYFESFVTALPTNSTLTSTPVISTNVTCNGSANGSASVTINNYSTTTTGISYVVLNASFVPITAPVTVAVPAGPVVPILIPNIGPLAPGTYYVQFTELGGVDPGCSFTTPLSFTISQSATPLVVTASVTKNDNCNVNAGQIVAVGSGGTMPYLYQILPAPSVIPLASSLLWSNINFLNAESGTYDVYIKDANGCIKFVLGTILPLDPTPVVAAVLANPCVAQGAYVINVTLPTAGIAPYTFSIDAGTFVSNTAPFTIPNLSSGTHTIAVKDANGCGNSVSVTILNPLVVSASFTTQPTCFNSNGTITAIASGGSGNYTYTLLSSTSVVLAGPQGGTTFGSQSAGCYIIRVTDTTTLCSSDTPFCLTLPTPVTFVATPKAVNCFAGNDGSITVTLPATNNNPVYTYALTAGPVGFVAVPLPGTTNNIFTGLIAGTYTVVVTSGLGCVLTDNNVIVGTPTAVVASGSATAFTCAANGSVNQSVLTIVGTFGTPGYTYSIDGTNYFSTNTFNITNTGAIQNITIYVKDLKGCIDTDVVVINPLPGITSAIVSQNTAITCTNPELVTITPIGGSGNYTYQVLPTGAPNVTQVGVVPTSNQFNISAPGTYFFQVNDLTTGCNFPTLAYTVAPFNLINVVASPSAPVVCFGDNNGAISINVTGYSGAYTYTVVGSSLPINIPGNTATNPLVISGLAAGSYTVVVTETNPAGPFCTFTSNATTVASPTQVALSLVSNVNANCNSGAVVTVSGSGGSPTYQYAFMQNGVVPVFPVDFAASNTAILNPITNTSWDVYVRDANGCLTFIDVIIAADSLPTITLPTFASNQCTSSGSSYTFTAIGTGLPPLTYSVGGSGFNSSNVLTVSAPGPYVVTIKDKNGCTATANITVYPPLGITASPTALPSCTTNDGVITVNTVGGSGTYSYVIAPSAPSITLLGNIFSGVPFGTYNITTTDVLTLCTKVTTITLGAPTPVTFTAVPTPVTCAAGTDGTITVTLPASNNNPVYTYAITAGPLTFPAQTSNTFIGLPTGTYTVQVTSGRLCQFVDNNVVVGTPNIIAVPIPTLTQFACAAGTNAVNLASIVVNGVTGGTPPYQYEFLLGAAPVQVLSANNTYTTSFAAGGTYTINIVDSKGCKGTTTATINPFISISNPTVVINKLIDCNTGENITVSVTTSGGIAPTYSYNATKVPVAVLPPYNVTNITGVFTGLPIGDYLITVTNPITGCSVSTFHYVNTPNTFNLLINNITTVTCFGDSNGSAAITVVDNNLLPTNDAGPFTWTILNSTGGTVQTGGALATPSAGPFTVSGLASGIYTANIVLANSPFCPVTQNFTIVQPDAPLAVTAVKSQITCIPGNDGIIVASATGGWGTNYTFQLQNGVAVVTNTVGTTYSYALNGTNTTFTNLAPGIYTVFVKDEKNCERSFPITLTSPLPIAANFTPGAPILCFGNCNGSINISYPTGGQGSNYSYTINGLIPIPTESGPIPIPLGGITINNLCADTYTITITDGFGCKLISTPIIIAQPTKVVAALSINTTQTCLVQTTLLLTGSGGTPPYSYSLNGAGFNPFTPVGSLTTTVSVPVGTYNYVIRDANGCISNVSGDVTILPLDPLVFASLTQKNILCGGLPDGTITAVANGGLLNYVYTLLNAGGVPIPGAVQSPPGSGNFINLLAGTYFVEVTSLDCIKRSIPITITEPPVFSYTLVPSLVKCNGDPTGTITINYTGGTGPFIYGISPNIGVPITITSTGFVVTGLSAGTYSVIVRDSNGCFQSPIVDTVIIGQPTPLTSTIASFVDEDCAEQDLGQITLGGISGGTGPYTVSYTVVYPDSTVFTLPPVAIATAAGYVFNNLNGGNYITIVKDANGCLSEQSQKIGSGVSYDPRARVTFPCVLNNPAVRVEVIDVLNIPSQTFNPLSDFLFNLDVNSVATAQASPIFTSAAYPSLLIPGSHTIYVFNANGCNKATQVFTITAADVDALTLTLSQGGLNEIVATSTGGSGGNNYTFNGNNNGSDNTYVYDATGDYTVTVTDNSGCSKTVTQPFVFIPIKIPNVFTPNGNGINDGWGPTNTANYPNLVTIVYDRYGRKLIELPEGKFWDGKYNGQELPSGDYWYVIRVDARNDSEYVGHFTLYR